MKIAISGATGFVGRHVVAEVDRRGLPATLLGRSGSPLTLGTTHRLVALDLDAPIADPFEAIGKPDVLIHLAWGGLPHYESLHHFENELPAQYRFLKAVIAGGLSNLLVTGTCFEYGMQSGALHEELDAKPTNAYGYAKNALRTQLEFLQRTMPFNLTWARLFYLYGDGQPETSLFPQLRAAVKAGRESFDMSGGEQLRDYLPVSEVARHLVTLALSGNDNGVVNICSGRPVSVRSLVESWIAENGWSIGLNRGHYPYPAHESMAFWGDRHKLDRCLEAETDS